MRIKLQRLIFFLALGASSFAGEGRVEISHLPFTIDQPGAYVVTDNLTGRSGASGITIDADHVTLDLNGFTLDGVTTNSLDGIRVNGSHRNLVVQNGILKNWGDDGLDATNSIHGRFEGLILSRNANAGLEAGFNCVVTRCVSFQNGTLLFPATPAARNPLGDGFRVESGSSMSMLLSVENSHHAIRGHSGSVIRDSVMRNNGHDGFHGSHASVIVGCIAAENSEGLEVDSGSRIVHCVAALNDEDGIRNKGGEFANDLVGGGLFSGNVAYSNQSNNIDVRGSGTVVKGCVSVASADHGVRVISGSLVKANLSAGTTVTATDNFHVEDGRNSRVEGNHSIELAQTDEGIQVANNSSGNLVIRNSASGDDRIKLGTNVNHGVEVNPADGFPADNAWVNFEYEP